MKLVPYLQECQLLEPGVSVLDSAYPGAAVLWASSGHTKKPRACSPVSGFCRVKPSQVIENRCQVPGRRVKMLTEDSSCEVTPNVHVSLVETTDIGQERQAIPTRPTESMSLIKDSLMLLSFGMIYCMAKVTGLTSFPLCPLLWLWWGLPDSGTGVAHDKVHRQLKQYRKNPTLDCISSRPTLSKVRWNTEVLISERSWCPF